MIILVVYFYCLLKTLKGIIGMNFKKVISVITAVFVMTGCICSCAKKDGAHIPHRFASAEEGRELMLANNENYYDHFSQNDLDFKMQKDGATMEEYKAFAAEQVLDFSGFEKSFINRRIKNIEKILDKNGYKLPELDEIVFIKTTMREELGASGYTHGTQIYLNSTVIATYSFMSIFPDTAQLADELICHELFHCLTRNNPEFKKDMYSLIHFTVCDKDFELPDSVFEYHITNPDVEHHDSYATFIIDGKEVKCFTDFITTKHFKEAQSTFFACDETALVPIDGTDIYYTPAQASNFDEVFGKNTGYVNDPEECLADNFAYALVYGIEGRDKQGYPNPEIIQGILDYLKK